MVSYLKALENAISEYHALEKSDQVYVFKLDTKMSGEKTAGETYMKDSKIYMTVGSRIAYGLIGHEAKHGYQYEMGEISFHPDGSFGELCDIYDEVDAYNRQYILEEGTKFNTTDGDFHSLQTPESVIVNDPYYDVLPKVHLNYINCPTFKDKVNKTVIKSWNIMNTFK